LVGYGKTLKIFVVEINYVVIKHIKFFKMEFNNKNKITNVEIKIYFLQKCIFIYQLEIILKNGKKYTWMLKLWFPEKNLRKKKKIMVLLLNPNLKY
jgi:hypothetical protein